jgi:hypothetical protein
MGGTQFKSQKESKKVIILNPIEIYPNCNGMYRNIIFCTAAQINPKFLSLFLFLFIYL